MPKKTSFLDPLIAKEKVKLGPQQYATHSNWHESTSNLYQNGHAKKGVFQPRERPIFTNDHMHEAKRKNLPPPNAYVIPETKRYILGVSDRKPKGSFHTDEAIV